MKKRSVKKSATKQVTSAFVKKLFEQLECPSGFIKELKLADTTKPAPAWEPHRHEIYLGKEDGSTTIRMEFVPGKAGEYYLGTGHTNFKTARGSFTFDRTGVEDSFYIPNEIDVTAKLHSTIQSQIERVGLSRERHNNSETVPGLNGGFLVTPEKKTEIATLLREGKTHTFYPSGFGTGYQVSIRLRNRMAHSNRILAEFLGLPMVYVETMECD
jgi:hypothetical protein